MKYIFSILLLFIAGCTCIDKNATSFIPVQDCNANSACFLYKAFADPAYPLEDTSAEGRRMEMLEKWLADNGYENAKYEITSKRCISKGKSLVGESYDVYYTVKVPKDLQP